MKITVLAILLTFGLFLGDFYAASGTAGTGQQNNRSGAGIAAQNTGQGGVSRGRTSVRLPGRNQPGATTSRTPGRTTTIDARNLNQSDLRNLLQNQARTGNNNIAIQTNRGVVNLNRSQLNDGVLQFLTTLNGTNDIFSGVDVANISDANLRARLFDLLDESNIGQDINIQVRDGVVSLSGFVVTQQEAEQLIRNLAALNLRGLNLQDSDLRLLSDPSNPLALDTATGQFIADPETGIVTTVPLTPSDFTQIGTSTNPGDPRAGISDTQVDPRLGVFENTDPRAGSDQSDVLSNFNDGSTLDANRSLNRNAINDSDLRLAVLDLLDSNGITSNNLVVESNSGAITLSGFASPLEADRIIQLIRSLNVDQINLNLTLVR